MASSRVTTLHGGWKLVALPAFGLAAAFCNSEGGSEPVASTGGGIGGSGGAWTSSSVTTFAGSGQAASGTGGNGGGEIPIADAGIPDDALPPEPMVTCDPASDAGSDASDAGSEALCPLPDPTCALDRWLVYYKNPECVDGICHFEVFVYDCGLNACHADGCYLNMTAI